jgi:dephospho-CoA kinase
VAYVVGMTGGIGSGKTEVARAFSALGVEVVDADAIAHRLSMPGQAGHAAISAAFDPGVLLPSGELDRAELRASCFCRPRGASAARGRRAPPIRRRSFARWRMARRLWRGGRSPASSAAALASQVDRVLVVDCPEDEQIRESSPAAG